MCQRGPGETEHEKLTQLSWLDINSDILKTEFFPAHEQEGLQVLAQVQWDSHFTETDLSARGVWLARSSEHCSFIQQLSAASLYLGVSEEEANLMWKEEIAQVLSQNVG